MAGKTVVNTVQLGDSATATQNFVLKTNADGTAVLARGNDGATTQDILTIDAQGNVTNANSYNSGEQTITSSGTLTLAHGLGAVPPLLSLSAICKTAEFGYSIGDIVELSVTNNSSSAADNYNLTCKKDATNVTVLFGANAGVIVCLNSTTRVATNLTNTNWKLIVRAWVL